MKVLAWIISRIRGEQNIRKLIKKGLKIGRDCNIQGGVIIDDSHCFHIEIGNNVTLAPRVHILAHDASTKTFLDYTKISNVKIGNNVFIGAGAIILPGSIIEDNVIIGAGSIVSKRIPANSVAVGSPAKVVSTLHDYLEKEKEQMCVENCFGASYSIGDRMFSERKRQQLLDAVKKHMKIYLK